MCGIRAAITFTLHEVKMKLALELRYYFIFKSSQSSQTELKRLKKSPIWSAIIEAFCNFHNNSKSAGHSLMHSETRTQ